MIQGGFGNVVLAPISAALSRVLVQISETVSAAQDVLIEQESFREMARYLERIRPLLMELQEKNLLDTPPLRESLNILENQIRKSRELIDECRSKSKFYLLFNCRAIVKQIQDITREIGRSLSLIPMASMNLSAENSQNAKLLLKDMQNAHFKAALAGEEIVGIIESGMRSHRVDSNFSNDLLLQIAQAVGVPVDPPSLREELQKFKKEKEEIELHKDQAEAYQLEQIIAILNGADAATTPTEKKTIYRKKKMAGGNQSLPALQSFFCPITQEVMEDPVEIASGQTFERSAIQKWFLTGNRLCPTTKVELESFHVKPNVALRQSIEEWKERNTIISIAATRPILVSGNQDEIQNALLELFKLSEEKPLHRYWIASEHLIPEIVKLLIAGNRDIRKRTLATLWTLAKNDENKKEIAAEDAIPIIVRSLARDVGESRQAVAVLLELSKIPAILVEIGKAQGCILLLVTMLRSEDSSAIEDARQLLLNLSYRDINVVQMAEANYFPPMVRRLNEGSEATKILMAGSLSKMSLTDESKIALAKEGAIGPLVDMLASGKLDYQSAALGALQSLSAIPENRQPMITAGILPPLLCLLFSITSAVMTLKEEAAATLANIAAWDAAADDSQVLDKFKVLQTEDTVVQLLTLMSLTGPAVQSQLLRGLITMCSKTTAAQFRQRLRKAGAVELLINFFLEADDSEVKTSSLKLLFWISAVDGGKVLSSHLDTRCMDSLVKFISTSQNDEARGAALGVIGNLPQANLEVMKLLQQAEVLPAIVKVLSDALSRISTKAAYNFLLENAASAVLLFSNPSNQDVQMQAASYGIIPSLVKLLGIGNTLTKSSAATALGQFSENSGKLSSPIPMTRACCFFSQNQESGCPVHGGKCSVRSSFCLVQAEAISPLVQTLADSDGLVHEAALGALTTLLYDDTWENGVHVIANAQGVRPVVRLLTVGSTGAKEKAVWMLEKIFRFDKYKDEYKNAAQMPLIDLTQKGSASTRQLAAKILAHLNILHNQSSYF